MSATYSSANLPCEPATSTVNALCLSLNNARKRFSFDERGSIKKRRKQSNPVRLFLEPIENSSITSFSHCDVKDTNLDVHSDKRDSTYLDNITLSNNNATNSELCTVHKVSPKQPFKTSDIELEYESSSSLLLTEPTADNQNSIDSVPLNLTKSVRSTPCKLDGIASKIESKSCAPPVEDMKNVKSEFSSQDQEIAGLLLDDRKDASPPFSPRPSQPVSTMRDFFTNSMNRATTCRIFNPEAFCNICNKEFCNKYFLKTHKANKHGVYCESKEAINANDTELPTVPLMFSWNVKNNAVKVPAAAAIASATVSNAYVFHTNNTVKDSSAFCNVCEKEFCNKYFLRRHKEKMHGITPFNESRKSGGDQSSEKSEEDERLTLAEEVRFSLHNDRISELNHNFNTKFDKTKFSKYTANSTDTVSDFIRLYLSGGNKILREYEKFSNDDAFIDGFQNLREKIVNSIKREQDEKTNPNKHISKAAAEYEQRRNQVAIKTNSTSELGVQAKDEDFNHYERVVPESSFNAANTNAVNSVSSSERNANSNYSCEYCKKILSTSAIRKLHKKYVHAVNSDSNKDDSEFRHMESVYFMILKFSWLHTTVTFCEICRTDFEKNDALEMHLMNKHGVLVDELSRIIEDAGVNGLSAPSLNIGEGKILCQICSKTFPTNAAFQQHVYEKCNYLDISSEFYANVDDTDLSKSNTKNFCEICKKELCNKYFMKTHMRRMHGIAIQNGVRIGGVTCEICNKELCSKYFLRVHKKNCHGIMDKSGISRFLLTDSEQLDISQPCAICGRTFKSIKWLKTHLLNDHGKLGIGVWQEVTASFQMADAANDLTNAELPATLETSGSSYSDECGEEKRSSPQLYDCSKCQFQLPSIDALLAHQRLHAKASEDALQYQCMYCFIVTKDKLSLEEHITYHHLNTADFHEKIEFTAHFQVNNDAERIETKSNAYRVPNNS